jgi:hypothetical protein
MIRNIAISITGLLLLIAVSAQAQGNKSTARIERQHKITHFQHGQMQNSEASILQGLESNSARLQQTSIQSLRELMQLAPDYPFSTLISPLEAILNNEQGDRIVRWLSALALDELHSDAGDAAIKAMSVNSEDKGLQTLCQALLIRSTIE